MKEMFLIGKKVGLRGLEENDLVNIENWLNDIDTTRLLFQGDLPPNLEIMKDDYNNRIKTAEYLYKEFRLDCFRFMNQGYSSMGSNIMKAL